MAVSVRIENLVKYFGSTHAVDHITLTVQPGDIYFLLGPSGCGKTTLLKLACGYIWPNAGGEIYRNGKALANLRELRKSIGWVTASGWSIQCWNCSCSSRWKVSLKFCFACWLPGWAG